MQDQLCGYIENIVFCQPDTGFTVAKLKVPSQKDPIPIVGTIPSVQPGETIHCKGVWKSHPQHGRQFEVASFELTAPSDVVGIQKYLESGMIKGIGPAYAERIVKKFGAATLDILDSHPDKLLEVDGIGEKRIDKIKTCWQEQKAVRGVMIFLRGHGVSTSYAQKIYKTYGDASIEKVTQNPFSLAKDIFGIGFKTADQIAQNIGIPKDSPVRLNAAIEHILWTLSNEGHTCFPKEDLASTAHTLLDIPVETLKGRIEDLIKQQVLFYKEDKVWIKPLYLAEIGIAREIERLSRAPSFLRAVDLQKAIAWVQEQLRLSLAKEQAEAVCKGLQDKMLIITGGPGTGKSTITKAILRITEKLSSKILLAAPTGRAAKRMSEITYKKAFTIHGLLEIDFSTGKFKKNKENPLDCDLIIVDEASMIDTLLLYNLLKAIPSHARVILIGDIDQLPSVGAGNTLKDCIASAKIPMSRLKQIFRQAASSRIITNAHKVNQGYLPDTEPHPKSDFIFISKETPEEILQEIVEQVTTLLPKKYPFHRFTDIQVLSPMKKGIIGAENLNLVLQQRLNPSPTPIFRMGRMFHLHDKVMQIRNNYKKEVFNGDIGRITELNVGEQTMKVSFDGKIVDYDFTDMDELVLAYAVSIHKYQGSECPCIVIPIHISHFKLLTRNLIYTGITRGKKLVVLIGTKKALAIAVKNEEVKKRYTGLKEFLEETMR